jgi:Ser/Thr protein kinase RdoA (MazF antagonist)
MTGSAWGDESTRFFFELTPDRVLEAVERAGLQCTGRCMALGSFENRVYDVELESESAARSRVVAKFYRPGRWSREQILEEHRFLADLAEAEIPAVAPLAFPPAVEASAAAGPGTAGPGTAGPGTAGDPTLRKIEPAGIWYSLFPKVGGRAPDELSDEQLTRIGRLLARVHNAGAVREAPNRVRLDVATYGRSNLKFLLDGRFLPGECEERYRETAEKIFTILEPELAKTPVQRIHGDCHFGNLLWSQQGPFFLDFDDMVRGPVVQDVWLLVPGRDEEAIRQREVLLEGYGELRGFDRAQLGLIEGLRALRFIHYSAWVARRWQDPAFPLAFPEFGKPTYWQKELRDLEDQLTLLEARRSG